MGGRSYCFVPGCKTGYSSDRKACKIQGKKVCSLFTPPLVFIKTLELNEFTIKNISGVEDICSLLLEVDSYTACAGVDDKSMTTCRGRCEHSIGRFTIWCKECKKLRKKRYDSAYKRLQNRPILSRRKICQHLICAKRKNVRLKQKVTKLCRDVAIIKKKCADGKTESVLQAIKDLPQSQQEAIMSCLEAAKANSGTGRRYTVQWIYECLLIKIKSKKTYEHLHSHQILALPSVKTLYRYIKKIRGAYGFQNAIFQLMKEKAVSMDPSDRRGTLLIDEMKVSPSLEFNRQTLKVEGFTDLGQYTPVQQKSVKGDHALVFMFQPFKGKWVQALACFLSKSAATGSVLHHLVMECIILLENAGFYVDVVTSDGASWNRNMWTRFGISVESVSCSHFCDPSRRLWFISDFPHLVKNIRNAITDKKYMMIPGGIIKLNFWTAVLEMDNPDSFSLKVCPKLKPNHIAPKHYQKMNVAMAFQFFSNSVACGMEMFQDLSEKLQDSDGCIKFIRRMNALIDAMNSRTPKTALKVDSNAQEAITSFLKFLEEWELYAKEKATNFISESTCYGLKVTLQSTLEVLEYLTSKCHFSYLMTARLNQDSLERFFSMMRSASGCNDHPDSGLFVQLFRLLSTYSLVKPPRGSNISGGDLIHSLCTLSEVSEASKSQADFNEKLDSLLKGCTDAHIFQEVDHNYNVQTSAECVTYYLAGYFAWRAQRFTKCLFCKACLFDEEISGEEMNDDIGANRNSEESEKLLLLKQRVSLCRPSLGIHKLVLLVETATMNVLSKGPLEIDTMAKIISDLENLEDLPLIGCLEHQDCFTHRILKFCLVTRMHFACSRANSIDTIKTSKTKELRKLSKLV